MARKKSPEEIMAEMEKTKAKLAELAPEPKVAQFPSPTLVPQGRTIALTVPEDCVLEPEQLRVYLQEILDTTRKGEACSFVVR